MADNIRIGKVLKEYNIGLGTLVDFLSKKGLLLWRRNLPKSREPKRSLRW